MLLSPEKMPVAFSAVIGGEVSVCTSTVTVCSSLMISLVVSVS